MEDRSYQQGRIDQMRWVVERLTTWVQSHREAVAFLPDTFRLFLSEFIVAGVEEAEHGTRCIEEKNHV